MISSTLDGGGREAVRVVDTCRQSSRLLGFTNQTGAYRYRPGGKRFRLRVVVGRLATLKVDQASIAEAQFSLAA